MFGSIRFVDGIMPAYDRPYLVVGVYDDHIDVLNVSSIKGKEHKLLFPSNREIVHYSPPFSVPSFVKLDSLVSVPIESCDGLKILNNGNTIDAAELDEICKALEEYQKK